MDILAHLAADPAIARIAASIAPARHIVARGSVGSSTLFLAAALARLKNTPVLLVLAHTDDADEALDTLTAAGVPALLLPALESLPGETNPNLELLAERLATVRAVAAWSNRATLAAAADAVVIAPIHALMQAVPDAAQLTDSLLTLRAGESPGQASVVRWLDQAGYRRADAVEEPGDFALRGGILDIFPPRSAPVRLDFFGDTIDRMTEIDLDTMGADRAIPSVELIRAAEAAAISDADTAKTKEPAARSFIELLPPTTPVLLHELLEITEQARGYYERLTKPDGVASPPAVLKLLRERLGGLVESSAIGQYTSSARDSADAPVVELPVSPAPNLAEDADKAVAELGELALGSPHDGRPTAEPLAITVLCQNAAEQTRLGELLAEFAPDARPRIASRVQYLHAGFLWSRPGQAPALFLPYQELLHRFQTRRSRGAGGALKKLRAGRAMDTFLDLAVGDYVVHTEHGIARFTGLRTIKPRDEKRSIDERITGKSATRPSNEQPGEYLTLEFEGGALLHVPAVKIDQVQKYIGGFKGKPPLSTLGGQRWKNQKQRVTDSVRDLAAELLRVRAAREHLPGIRYPADTAWQKEFEAEFPYEETEDQLAALAEIKRDMASPRPMDRLLCGDVGFGKTELAVRAAFKAAEFGKQVAVLVPTTVLAEQHERTFAARLKDYPFKVASLSRFKTTAEINEVLKRLAKGQIDIVIGTHRLISRDVAFADLGLVVIDEEQRFGVEHKERLLALRMTVDVLTLSATPIPRTLHMSMLGLRDISSLATAPVDRRAVVTEVIPYNERRIEAAIARELARDGQVYFVHNRVHNITEVADEIQRLAPGARIVVGHGQMAGPELEDVMLKFMRRQADILVSTTIIESGIDNPAANTMLIADADRFGLADLHQLRGRVGRAKNRAYCYLLLPNDRPVKENAKKRLKAVEQYSMLGAGFKIAMRDLEIRGAGNILGPEQSGHIAAVGYDMYCQLLERAVRELKNEVVAAPSEVVLELGPPGMIPKPYIPSDTRRLEAYRRVALAASPAELTAVEADLTNAYGPIPPLADLMLQLAEVRIGSRLLGIRSIVLRDKDVLIRTTQPADVLARFAGVQGHVTAVAPRAPHELPEVYFRPPGEGGASEMDQRTLLAILRKRLAA